MKVSEWKSVKTHCMLLIRILLLIVLTGLCSGQGLAGKAITIWLIPSEPSPPEAEMTGMQDCLIPGNSPQTLASNIEKEIEEFNRRLSLGHVTVLNTQEPFKAQLVNWSPEMAVPNWIWVRSQVITLQALERFARDHSVHVNVRFITWDRAFEDLRQALEADDSRSAPDVAQIGSTWKGYFAARHQLVSRTGHQVDRQGWEDVGSTPASALPYIYDVRLIFYWKRLPMESSTANEFRMNSGSWKAAVDSIRNDAGRGPAFAFPTGLTLNLLHDYASLVWAGDGKLFPEALPFQHRVDLTSSQALASAEYLAANLSTFEQGHTRNLLAFPEASHQEVVRLFVTGVYRGTLEPANFVGRWREHFNRVYGSDSKMQFWDYAAVAVPPRAFKGGSDLVVFTRTRLPNEAFDLAQFIASDDEYTRMLGASGHLPARRGGYGVDLLIGSPSNDASGARQFVKTVQEALDSGMTYPDIPQFPTEIEARPVLERLQEIWRRIGEGDLVGLRSAAQAAELSINRQIYWRSQLSAALRQLSWFIAFAVIGFLAIALHLNRRRVTALQHVTRVRGFSAAGTLLFETIHGTFHNPLANGDIGHREAVKGAMILAGLQGWRRGRDPKGWSRETLDNVIWRSIMLAYDSVVCLGIFKEWESSGQPAPIFLEALRTDPRLNAVQEIKFAVTCPPGVTVPTPFMLEQALVCLLQNSLKTLLHPDFAEDIPPLISISYQRGALTLSNPGPPLDVGLCDAINKSASPEEFEERITALLKEEERERKPGFGLVEAYCIASQCYGGLSVKYDEPSFTICLSRPKRNK